VGVADVARPELQADAWLHLFQVQAAMTKPAPKPLRASRRHIDRMLNAINHPSILVQTAARQALTTCEVADIDNLARWLDRMEPGWKYKPKVSWSDW
jgi:uncharacterized alpha-E superfamily protein